MPTGKRAETFRWTAKRIAQELGLDHHAVASQLKVAGMVAGDDTMFSTKQAMTAVYGNKDDEYLTTKIIDTKASTLLKNIDADNKLKNNIPASMVEKVWCDYIRDVTEKIKQSALPLEERNNLLNDLGKIPIDKYFENLVHEKDTAEELD